MVSLRTVVLLAALPAYAQQLRFPTATPNSSPLGKAVHSFAMQNARLPAKQQTAPSRPSLRPAPRKMALAAPQTNSGKCSIPLINALAGKLRQNELRMPTVRPGDIEPMPNVQPPAPPCRNWPPK